MIQFNFRIFLRLHFRNDFTPHTGFRQHVGFIHGGYLTPAHFSRFKSLPGNPFHFRPGVEVYIRCSLHAVNHSRFVMGAEVNAAGQFTDDQQVRIFHPLRF